jgi:hypothetical protein
MFRHQGDVGSHRRETPVGTAKEYRDTAWDCLKLAEGTSSPRTRAALLDLAQEWVKLAEQDERNNRYKLYPAKGYRAWARGYRTKAQECMSLAESINDPERRADLLLFGRLWMSLTEPMDDLAGAYELPSRRR